MENAINAQNFYQTLVSDTSITIGVGQTGTVSPPELLRINATGSFTVLLPPINTIQPVPPMTTQATVGVAGAFEIAIVNAGGATITITPYGSDVTMPNPIIFSTSIGSFIRLRSNTTTATWYQVGG